MHYGMKTPCPECPFRKGSGFTVAALKRHAAGEFPCHKTANLLDGEYVEKPGDKSAHCAGALIFNEKRGQPHQMARIVSRLGMYDRRTLDMAAPIGMTNTDLKRGNLKDTVNG